MKTEKIIGLRSGGQLTLTADFDPFELSAADRAFAFGLVDALTQYEKSDAPVVLNVEPPLAPPVNLTGAPPAIGNTLPNSDRHYGG